MLPEVSGIKGDRKSISSGILRSRGVKAQTTFAKASVVKGHNGAKVEGDALHVKRTPYLRDWIQVIYRFVCLNSVFNLTPC